MNNKTKKSQLCFDPKLGRRLLKMNGEVKFCPYCGKDMADGCECHKNIVIDIKPYRNEDGSIVPDRSVLVFDNNSTFQVDYSQMVEDARAKKETNGEFEKVAVDLD